MMESVSERRFGLSTSELKLLAILSMIIDHVGKVFYPQYHFMRCIGRAAFPLYIFVLVEGFFFTSSRAKYLARLLIFAVLSEAPFDLGLYGRFPYHAHQNVFFTLFLGMAAMIGICLVFETVDTPLLQILFQLLILGGCMVLAQLFLVDYKIFGVGAIAVAWLLKYRGFDRVFEIIIIVAILCMQNPIEIWAAAAIPLVALYDPEKEPSGQRWLFYGAYPGHLLLIYGIRVLTGRLP